MELVEKKWEEILQKTIEDNNLSEIVAKTWLQPLEVYSIEDNVLTILFSGEKLALNIIEKKYKLPLKVAIAEVTGTEYELKFISLEDRDNLDRNNDNSNNKEDSPANHSASVHPQAARSNLNPNYTFDTFVVGSNNQFAHSASLAVAEAPGAAYNPLFLYGGVGLGKTHLMHSIAHYIIENSPGMQVLYVPSESFTNEVIESIRKNTMQTLREKYRRIDVLLIDDVQFIIGKESTQEEFFHTFNELHTANKQIILSSDRPPKEILTLEERIRSRFEWGLLADIGSPDYETRMAILRKKSELDGFTFSDEILNYIAINIKSNIRELEGALNKLAAYAKLQNTDINLSIASRELKNLIFPGQQNEITPQLILEVVAEHFEITIDQLMSNSRKTKITKPRQIAMYLCSNMTNLTQAAIGALVGGRDHSTVIYGIEKIEAEYKSDPAMRQTIEAIKKKISPELNG